MSKYTIKNRFALLALGILAVILIGNIGYILVKTHQGADPTMIEAMYWTLVTLTTLGSYPADVSIAGNYGMILTILIVLSGVFTLFIGLQIAIGPWIEETMKRAVKEKTEPIPKEKHVIVCGYTELGREVIRNLSSHDVPFTVITESEEKSDELKEKKIPFILGDPTNSKILKKANIEEAISLIAVSDDATNSFISLTARNIDPEIRIVSSIKQSHHEGIVKRAGANHVISPKSITGAMIGGKAIHGSIVGMGQEDESILSGLKIEHIKIGKDSKFTDKTIQEADIGSETGAAIIGVWKKGKLHAPVSPGLKIEHEDIVLAVGEEESLKKLKEYGG